MDGAPHTVSYDSVFLPGLALPAIIAIPCLQSCRQGMSGIREEIGIRQSFGVLAGHKLQGNFLFAESKSSERLGDKPGRR
jgi:hypothetical protein